MRLFAASLAACIASAAQAAPIVQKSGVWWGDVPTPQINQVWMQADFVQPDATVSGTISFPLTCTLPQPNSLRLSGVVIQVDGNNIPGNTFYGSNAARLLNVTRT